MPTLHTLKAERANLHDLQWLDALALASVTVDFRITQAMNLVRGVHASPPHGAIC